MRNLRKIYLRKGNGPSVMDANLRDVLEELWKIQKGSFVDGLQLESEKARYVKHFRLLAERGCIDIVESVGGRGRPGIARIRLLTRTLDSVAFLKTLKAKEPNQEEKVSTFSVPEGFELVSKAMLRELREKAKPPVDPRNDGNVALLFVDAANLTGERKFIDGQGKDSGARILPIGEVNWRVVMETVVRGYKQVLHVSEAIAYVSSHIPDMQFVRESLRASLFTPVFYEKDTDVLMAADIVHFCRDEMERRKQVTLVLVTGDRDYSRAIERVRESALRTGTTLSVWVISWKNKIGHLRKSADWVSYVESIPGFLDRMTRRNTKRPTKIFSSLQAVS